MAYSNNSGLLNIHNHTNTQYIRTQTIKQDKIGVKMYTAQRLFSDHFPVDDFSLAQFGHGFQTVNSASTMRKVVVVLLYVNKTTILFSYLNHPYSHTIPMRGEFRKMHLRFILSLELPAASL
jgi:hypothetical protein